MALTHFFSPLRVGAVELKNRIFSTGRQTVLVDDGAPNDALIAYQEARARGETPDGTRPFRSRLVSS